MQSAIRGDDILQYEEVEVWMPIDIPEVKGFYMVSNYGNIKSLRRADTRGRERKGKYLKLRKNMPRRNGYYYHVCLCKGSWQKNFKVHRLVATAFIDGCFEGATVNHIDGDKINNHYKNWRWLTDEIDKEFENL